MLKAILVVLLMNAFIGASQAQDCAAITKYGIFDVRKTSQQTDLADDFLKWLSINEFNSQQDAHNAGMKTDIIIPYLDVPANSDNTYGDNHSSNWTKATIDYLQAHQEKHLKFAEDFSTANSAIVDAWKECVMYATGLICWATPTDRQDEVILNLEVRPVVIPVPPSLYIANISNSPSLRPIGSYKYMRLNTKPRSLLFHRAESNGETAGNFSVSTNSEVYACSAEVPSIPPKVQPDPLPYQCIIDLYGDLKGATMVQPFRGVAGNLLTNASTLEGTWPVECSGFKPNTRIKAVITISFSKAGGDNRVSVAEYIKGSVAKGPTMQGTISGSGFTQQFVVEMSGNTDALGVAAIGFYLGIPTLNDGSNLTAGPGSNIVITTE
jgi:hypothetical protein